MIPALLESADSGFLVGRGGYQPSDLCVSAPTGSGKTLAFVVPVVQVSEYTFLTRAQQGGSWWHRSFLSLQALLHRVVCHMRALAVLPTKELAQQVCPSVSRVCIPSFSCPAGCTYPLTTCVKLKRLCHSRGHHLF